MLRLLWILIFASQVLYAQKSKKNKNTDNLVISSLQAHIGFLADDKLEGRRTGSNGEKLAYEYISNQFTTMGLLAKGDDGGFIQAFDVNEGRQINKTSVLNINGFILAAEKDYFPFSFSGNGSFEAAATIALPESGMPWFLDIKDMIDENKTNPHFDLSDAIRTKSIDVATKGATGLIVYNSSATADELKFEPKAKVEPVKVPVVYITNAMKKRFLKDEGSVANIKLTIDIGDKKRVGHNVIGYIDNGAPLTIIIGAHYDHLGYGEDKNSLFTGTVPAIHNGADDNASGTAALIELGKMLKTAYKNNNYLFISFSGEELGLFGSKYFTEHPTIDLTKANYMINLDMVGRLNDSTHGLNIGGYGTSPTWGELMSEKNEFFKIKFDSSGTGPSDHTSFYRKDIPVLFFFTGVHSDYHKPTDDADKINYTGELQVVKYIYTVIGDADKKGKLAFTKTRESQSSGKSSSFKVTLGIMPDYTFSGPGVKVDGVSEGKLAQRVGIKTGDVITQIGEHKFSDMQGYMETLGKFKKGDATKVKLKRGAEDLEIDIVF